MLCRARKFKKWNRLLSTVVACLTFLLLLGYVMYNLFSSSGESSSDADLVEASTSTVLVSTIASSIIASSSTETRNLVTDKCVVISDMITCNSAGADENIADLVNTAASSEVSKTSFIKAHEISYKIVSIYIVEYSTVFELYLRY